MVFEMAVEKDLPSELVPGSKISALTVGDSSFKLRSWMVLGSMPTVDRTLDDSDIACWHIGHSRRSNNQRRKHWAQQ